MKQDLAVQFARPVRRVVGCFLSNVRCLFSESYGSTVNSDNRYRTGGIRVTASNTPNPYSNTPIPLQLSRLDVRRILFFKGFGFNKISHEKIRRKRAAIGLSVCGSRTQPKTMAGERCDGARVWPNPSFPLPLRQGGKSNRATSLDGCRPSGLQS